MEVLRVQPLSPYYQKDELQDKMDYNIWLIHEANIFGQFEIEARND